VKHLWMSLLVFELGIAAAEVPPILIEACSMLEPASKRIECLQVANQQPQGQSGTNRPAPIHAPSYLAAPVAAMPMAPTRSSGYSTGSSTCHVGPRGGTYTITKSGKKNYGGC
jgi:hypothetical protein